MPTLTLFRSGEHIGRVQLTQDHLCDLCMEMNQNARRGKHSRIDGPDGVKLRIVRAWVEGDCLRVQAERREKEGAR